MQTTTSPDPLPAEETTPDSEVPQSRAKPFDPDLRNRLDEYREQNRLSVNALARELGQNATAVSKYLSGKPEGNVQRLESVIADVLKSAAKRALVRIDLFETSVSRSIGRICETIRKTNDIGLIYGEAGVGKTCGLALYAQENPSVVSITLTRWNRDVGGLEASLFGCLENSGWSGNQRRAEFICGKLKDSNRLIIIDNAHRLTSGGRQWLFDFHDETSCPIALVGNPEVLDAIRRNDQQFSRIGLKREVALKEDVAEVAHKITQHFNGSAKDVHDLSVQVVKEQGHLRALKKQLILSQELQNSTALKGKPRLAFKSAHTQLVRDYKLKEEGGSL